MITLQTLLELQEDLQTQHMGGSPRDMDLPTKMRFISDMHTALSCELVEALDETGWKPWTSTESINVDRYLGELVDALHFFLNLILVAGGGEVTAFELAGKIEEGYLKKRAKNAQRQIDGYDGVTGKCFQCHTDLEEAGIVLSVSRTVEGRELEFCCLGCSNTYAGAQ